MAIFKPELPSLDDWTRDPAGSWGRLWQAVNYSVDLYNATKGQIPVLYQRIDGFNAQLGQFPDSAARQAIVAQLQRHQQALDALVAQQNGLEGKVLDTISQARTIGQQLGQAPAMLGLGQVQAVLPVVVIAAVGLVLAGVIQLATTYQARKAESETLQQNVLRYAQAQHLTPDQLAQVTGALNQLPPPKDVAKGLFDQLGDLLPIAAGILLLVFLGPPLLKQLSAGMSRRGD